MPTLTPLEFRTLTPRINPSNLLRQVNVDSSLASRFLQGFKHSTSCNLVKHQNVKTVLWGLGYWSQPVLVRAVLFHDDVNLRGIRWRENCWSSLLCRIGFQSWQSVLLASSQQCRDPGIEACVWPLSSKSSSFLQTRRCIQLQLLCELTQECVKNLTTVLRQTGGFEPTHKKYSICHRAAVVRLKFPSWLYPRSCRSKEVRLLNAWERSPWQHLSWSWAIYIYEIPARTRCLADKLIASKSVFQDQSVSW